MMQNTNQTTLNRHTSFGINGLKILERIGVWLSHRAIRPVINLYTQPQLLDLGSGYGCRLFSYFRPQLGKSMVVDIDIDQRFKALPDLSVIQSTIEDAWPQIPKESFDIITIINVLEHVWDPQETLKEAFTRLRTGGRLIVNVPTWLGKSVHEYQAFRLGLSSPIEIDDHKCYFNKPDLWPLLVRAGFKPSRIQMRYHKFRLNLFSVATRQ